MSLSKCKLKCVYNNYKKTLLKLFFVAVNFYPSFLSINKAKNQKWLRMSSLPWCHILTFSFPSAGAMLSQTHSIPISDWPILWWHSNHSKSRYLTHRLEAKSLSLFFLTLIQSCDYFSFNLWFHLLLNCQWSSSSVGLPNPWQQPAGEISCPTTSVLWVALVYQLLRVWAKKEYLLHHPVNIYQL